MCKTETFHRNLQSTLLAFYWTTFSECKATAGFKSITFYAHVLYHMRELWLVKIKKNKYEHTKIFAFLISDCIVVDRTQRYRLRHEEPKQRGVRKHGFVAKL